MTTPEEPTPAPEPAPAPEPEEEGGGVRFDPVTGKQRTLADLEEAPNEDEIGTEADQYGSAEQLGDEDAGPAEGDGEELGSPHEEDRPSTEAEPTGQE